MHEIRRRSFIKDISIAGAGLALSPMPFSFRGKISNAPVNIGIIGLDTSHSTGFTKLLNAPDADPLFKGYRVVAAYPKGSSSIESSSSRIPQYTKEVQALGVEIVSSIDEVLSKADCIMLNTNDGRMHVEQALPVMKSGRRMFIDKPLSASLAGVLALFNAAEKYKAPFYTSSSMRYMENAAELRPDKIGKISGVDTYSPASLEKTHPDLFWYGMHGVEMLFTLMGSGCNLVSRIQTKDAEQVTGTWKDNRIGTFRGTRTGPHKYGGTVFGEKEIVTIQPAKGMNVLLQEIIRFFDTGQSPVAAQETIEIYAFMEAADESKRKGGAAVSIDATLQKARKQLAVNKTAGM